MGSEVTTGIIERFGDAVDSRIDDAPDKVRWWLNLGYNLTDAKHTVLPDRGNHPSGRMGAKICLDSVTAALNDFDQSCVTSIFMPSEPFVAMGVHPACAEAIANFSAGARAERGFIARAEAAGVPETYCSYHKVLMGMANSTVLPAPKMLASCSVACDANNLSFKALACRWRVPHCYIDVPYEVSRDSVAYVADQLRGLVEQAESVFGTRLEQDRLVEAVAHSQETLRLLARCLPLRRGRYAAADMGNEMQQALAAHLALGSAETERMARQMIADFEGAREAQGLNLVWVHTMPFFLKSLQEMIDRSDRAQIVASEMLYDQVPLGDNFWYGPDRPFEAMAERLVRNAYNGPASRRAARVRELCEATSADGAVVFCHWGCKETAGAAQYIRRELEAAGYPTLVLDGDGCDRANCMEGQMATRFGAFLELLEGRRGEKVEGGARG